MNTAMLPVKKFAYQRQGDLVAANPDKVGSSGANIPRLREMFGLGGYRWAGSGTADPDRFGGRSAVVLFSSDGFPELLLTRSGHRLARHGEARGRRRGRDSPFGRASEPLVSDPLAGARCDPETQDPMR